MARALTLSLMFALAGCAQAQVDAPSLLPRAIETRDSAEPEAAPFVTVADPAFDAEVAARSSAFDAAAAAFAKAVASAEPRVRRGARAAPASDAWLDAQAALTEVGGARATTDAALADLEALAIQRAEANKPPQPALDTKVAAANAEVAREGEIVDRLTGTIPPL